MLGRRVIGCVLIALAFLPVGCKTTSRSMTNNSVTTDIKHGCEVEKIALLNATSGGVVPVAYAPDDNRLLAQITDPNDPFLGMDVLQLDPLIQSVLIRNPTLQAAQAAWAAAAQRYPQAISLDDPMLQTMFAPATFPANSPVQSSYMLGLSQKVPWQGKRALRGDMALWNSQAAGFDNEQVKQRLATATRLAFYDYYLVNRELDLNQRNIEVMQDFRSSAKIKYESNQVSQQDVANADLELAKLQQQRLELEQSMRVATARINTLLHRTPDKFVPVPPQSLSLKNEISDKEMIYELAYKNRPELSALAARIQAEQNAVQLAWKEYYPDLEFAARYDAFWADNVQRPMVGLNLNVPVNQDRRCAAVREAQFKLRKLTAEYTQQKDNIAEEVHVTWSRVDTNQQTVRLFKEQILPAAKTNLETARAAYIAGSIDFLRLMDAKKQFIEQETSYQRTLAEYHRSRAELEQAIGTALPH